MVRGTLAKSKRGAGKNWSCAFAVEKEQTRKSQNASLPDLRTRAKSRWEMNIASIIVMPEQ
jgi:hypothetical protein